jgi:hypothetical protein
MVVLYMAPEVEQNKTRRGAGFDMILPAHTSTGWSKAFRQIRTSTPSRNPQVQKGSVSNNF